MTSFKSSGIHSKKHAQKRRRKVIGAATVLIGCLAVIIASGIYLFRAPVFQVSTINVEGTMTASPDAIQEESFEFLQDGDYLWAIPYTNIFFVPKRALQKSLQNDFPQINSISINRSGLTSITLVIEERMPAALACAGFRDEDNENDMCYYTDKDGYVYGKVATSTDTTTLSFNRYYIPTDKQDIAAGAGFIDTNRFHDLQKFIEGTAKVGIAPLGILIGDAGDYEMYIANPNSTSTETTIYFDDKAPFESTLSNLKTFWQNTKNKTSFDYINLRFGKTIYYSKQ